MIKPVYYLRTVMECILSASFYLAMSLARCNYRQKKRNKKKVEKKAEKKIKSEWRDLNSGLQCNEINSLPLR